MAYRHSIYKGDYIYKNLELYVDVFQISNDYFLIGLQNWELDINCGGYVYIKTNSIDKIIIKGIKSFIPKDLL